MAGAIACFPQCPEDSKPMTLVCLCQTRTAHRAVGEGHGGEFVRSVKVCDQFFSSAGAAESQMASNESISSRPNWESRRTSSAAPVVLELRWFHKGAYQM